MLAPTPAQTVGPFFGYALPFAGCDELVPPGSAGAISLHGTVFDGAGAPVPDALIEIWQADPRGVAPTATGTLHRSGGFTGFGRAETDRDGRYALTTLTPGGATPFFAVTVLARGLLNRLFTRAYVPSDALAADRFLAALPPERRRTLIATRDDDGLRFDIRLQAGPDGAEETVFLAYPGARP
jgi:protocatechuate 3,4-dioxygenase, alpha subunit